MTRWLLAVWALACVAVTTWNIPAAEVRSGNGQISSVPVTGKSLPRNPYTGGHARENIFEFKQKPEVRKEGAAWVITFAAKGKCDAGVAIVGPDGSIVRHLAGGVLGGNAPWPYKQNTLEQSVKWDGRDDRGKPAPAGCRARVVLGLKATFDKFLGWNGLATALGYRRKPLKGLACGPDGTLYILSSPWLMGAWITALSRDGAYARTLLPFPANLAPDKVKGYRFASLSDGTRFPVYAGRTGALMEKDVSVANGQVMAALPGGKIAWVTDGQRKSRTRRLLVLGTDGSTPAGTLFGLPLKQESITRNDGPTYLAAMPDGKVVFLSVQGKLLRVDRTGAGAVAPFGPDSIKNARGVAVGGNGDVYVADAASGRIVVLNADGAVLRSVPAADCDGAIAVHPRNGNLYVLSIKGKMLSKLSPEGTVLATLEAPCDWTGRSKPAPYVFALDGAADPPILWVINQNTSAKLWRVVDKGASFEKENILNRVKAPWVSSGQAPSYMALDPVRDELYVKCYHSLFRFDAKTGVAEALELSPPRAKKKWDGVNEIVFGPDGLLYVLSNLQPEYVWRFDREGRHVPFSATVDCIEATTGSFRGFIGSRGFDVAPNGDVYVEHYSRWRGPGGEYGSRKHPESRYILVDVFNPDGTLKKKGIIKELPQSAGGVRVDGAGNIYIGINARTRGYKEASYESLSNLYRVDRGMLLKFPPEGGIVNIGRADGPLGKPPADSNLKTYLDPNTNRFSPLSSEGHLWAWLGLSPMPSGWGCLCQTARFDVDAFGRIFAPDALTSTVPVLDTQGNTVLRIGGYGNPDSQGPESEAPEPAIPFMFPCYVEVADGVLYVNDYSARRFVRVRLGYEAEETVPLP